MLDPVKYLKETTIRKTVNPQFTIIITTDKSDRITNIRCPGGIQHIFRMGNILNQHQLENWMSTNGYELGLERNIKRQLQGNELIKFMMKHAR